MILDGLLLLDTASAITATAASANVIDLLNARDIGAGEPIALMCLVGTAFTTTNSATLNIQYQSSTDNSTYTTIIETGALAAAVLTANSKQFQTYIPRDPITHRYIRLNYVVGTGVFSAGTVTSGLVPMRDDNPSYPPGIVISN